MIEPDPESLAIDLAEAARRGDDLSGISEGAAIEDYREAAGLIRRANRDPRADVGAVLLLTDEELWRVDRQFRRSDALTTLYEAEMRRRPPDLGELSTAAAAIVSGVWEERDDLDTAIGGVSTGWRVERMPPVDRTVLRIALWELRHRPDTPAAVVIAEAVRLAKAYSTERSGGFVNGVLSRLAADER